jgi:hypothetical protein
VFLRNFKISYKEYISGIKFKNTASNSNFAKRVVENNHSIRFGINIDLEILGTQIKFTLSQYYKT